MPPLAPFVQRFMRAREGLAAIEFAMLAPVMLLIYFGLVEFSQAYMASRRANHTASIVADLIAQSEAVTSQDLALAFEIGEVILTPFDPAPLSIRVTSLTIDNNGNAKVDWSRSNGPALPRYTNNATLTGIPSGLINKGESLILGETHYTYQSRTTHLIKLPLQFNRSYYLRPRVSDKVNCSNC